MPRVCPWREFPFGDPGFDGCLRLPRAFRRLPRPSSAPEPSHPPRGAVPWPPGRSQPGLCCGLPALIEAKSPSRISPKGPHMGGTPRSRSTHHQPSPQREVIQPHLPVRLPCYDFSPLAAAGFDPPTLGNPGRAGLTQPPLG